MKTLRSATAAGTSSGQAVEAMRRVLLKNARRKQAKRHGWGKGREEMPELTAPAIACAEELLAVHEAWDE